MGDRGPLTIRRSYKFMGRETVLGHDRYSRSTIFQMIVGWSKSPATSSGSGTLYESESGWPVGQPLFRFVTNTKG